MNVVLLVGLLFSQSTWTVDDDSPGADFADLPAAVAAAADGDVLLVRPGSYSHFHLTGKGLSIVGEDGVTVERAAAGDRVTRIAEVPVGSQALLAGIEFPALGCSAASMQIIGPTTRATLIDLVLDGACRGGAGLIVASAEVMLVRTKARGGSGEFGGNALVAFDGARVFVVDSSLSGGGGGGSLFDLGTGGSGARAFSGSRVWIAQSFVTGGFGVGSGGDGITATFSARVRLSGAKSTGTWGGPGILMGGPGIFAPGFGSVLIHAVEVWSGGNALGDPPQPQFTGFDAEEPLPFLDCRTLPEGAGFVTLTLTGEPAFAPFFVWHETRTRIAEHVAVRVVGDLAFQPDWAQPVVKGFLSREGRFQATIPLGSLSNPYRPVRLQAGLGRSRDRVMLSNPIDVVLRPAGAEVEVGLGPRAR